MKPTTIALILAAAAAAYFLVLRKSGTGALATTTTGGGARGIDWQSPPPKLTGWSLLDPTIKGSPGQMAVGLFSSNERDS
jgi:hypothetical protein